jgi:hypothetical protein
MADCSFFLEALQHLQRAAGAHDILEGGVLGIVDIHNLNTIQPEPTQTVLDRALDLLAAEIAGLEIAIGLASQHIAGRQATQLAQRQPNSALALAIAIGGGGVDEIDWAAERRPQRRQRRIFRHAVGKRFGHIAERRTADTQRRNTQVG